MELNKILNKDLSEIKTFKEYYEYLKENNEFAEDVKEILMIISKTIEYWPNDDMDEVLYFNYRKMTINWEVKEFRCALSGYNLYRKRYSYYMNYWNKKDSNEVLRWKCLTLETRMYYEEIAEILMKYNEEKIFKGFKKIKIILEIVDKKIFSEKLEK